MVFNSNDTVWLRRLPPREPYPFLTDEQTVDFAIIGGGLAGVSSAFHLRQRFPDAKIVLIEAARLASGASGRSSGQTLNWINGISRADPETARQSYSVTRLGYETISAMAKTAGAENTMAMDGALELYTAAHRFEAAKREVDRLNAVGIPLRALSPDEFSSFMSPNGVSGAVLDPNAGQLDAPAFIETVARWLVLNGVSIYEGSPVESIIEDSAVHVQCATGSVRAERVILGTNAATTQLGFLKNRIFSLHSLVFATDPHPPEFWRQKGIRRTCCFADDRDRIAYGCLTHRGELIFGGGSNASYRYLFGGRIDFPGSHVRGYQAIEKVLFGYLPELKDISFPHRWSGVLDMTFDRCCSFGTTGRTGRIFYMVGFCGHGLVLTNLAGRVVADMCAGDEERWRDQPFYRRALHFIPPEPFRWIGYHLYAFATGRSLRRY